MGLEEGTSDSPLNNEELQKFVDGIIRAYQAGNKALIRLNSDEPLCMLVNGEDMVIDATTKSDKIVK